MKPYGIPTDQIAKYKESVHAAALFDKKDMSAPTCNSCHGNHGAVPPEVKSIASVCRQCHPSTGELFAKSPHKKAFDDMGQSECEACHGNHKIVPPTDGHARAPRTRSVCLQCHDKGSKGYAAPPRTAGRCSTASTPRIKAARGRPGDRPRRRASKSAIPCSS